MRSERLRTRFFWMLQHTVNPLATAAARSGRGPFSLVRHVGRKTGTIYQTPLIVARVPRGFVAELTYGPNVSWYRNVVAAGQCVLIVKNVEYDIGAVRAYSTEAGLDAFGYPQKLILKLLRRKDFRLLELVQT
jgi:deazaflavin-dependent oxidoreductase (nitroreductase family)